MFRRKPIAFISYRRNHTQHVAHRIADELGKYTNKVIIDIDFDGGRDFRDTIKAAISSSDIIIALIDHNWVDEFSRRQGNEDYVRDEIRTALLSEKILLPVLIDDSKQPKLHEIPADIAPISFRHSINFYTGKNFKISMKNLSKEMIRSTRTGLHEAWSFLGASLLLFLAIYAKKYVATLPVSSDIDRPALFAEVINIIGIYESQFTEALGLAILLFIGCVASYRFNLVEFVSIALICLSLSYIIEDQIMFGAGWHELYFGYMPWGDSSFSISSFFMAVGQGCIFLLIGFFFIKILNRFYSGKKARRVWHK